MLHTLVRKDRLIISLHLASTTLLYSCSSLQVLNFTTSNFTCYSIVSKKNFWKIHGRVRVLLGTRSKSRIRRRRFLREMSIGIWWSVQRYTKTSYQNPRENQLLRNVIRKTKRVKKKKKVIRKTILRNTGKSSSSWRTKETTLRQGQEEDASMSQHSVGLSLPEIR